MSAELTTKYRKLDSSSSAECASESDSSNYYKHGRKFPCKTSEWKMSHLLVLGIHYDNSSTDLETFMSNIKQIPRKPQSLGTDSEVHKCFIGLTKDLWKFSFDFERAEKSLGGNGVVDTLRSTEKAIEAFEQENSNIMESLTKTRAEDWKSLQVYSIWRKNLLEFWRYLCMLLIRWGKPHQRVGRFTYLFMAFSKICFLHPEPGYTYSDILQIKDSTIRGTPDVRFMTFPPSASFGGRKNLELVVTEVEQYDAFKGNYVKAENFNSESLSPNVLARHGIQLLMQRECSFFFPAGVVGILCTGTKVIFTFLQISQFHYQLIRDKGKVGKTSRATISYTRPYDYMDASDRNQLVDAFFWFGQVQSNPKDFT